MASNEIEVDGWTAVPRSLDQVLHEMQADANQPVPVTVAEIGIPGQSSSSSSSSSKTLAAVTEYARRELDKPTFNHSMRVYLYARAIQTQIFKKESGGGTGDSNLQCSPETLLLASLLHDIGTTSSNITATRLSFEYWGGLRALEVLKQHGTSTSTAESVAETIIRHQDVAADADSGGHGGNITTLTALIHFATLLDNAGAHPELVHRATIENVVAAYPRLGWTACFAGVVRREIALKPWSHTTTINGFAEKVEANTLMAPYD